MTLDGQKIAVKGPKGQLAYTAPEEIRVAQEDGHLTFTPTSDSQRAGAMWGLTRTLVSNMVEGVTKGYEETLELIGVGYRAAIKGKNLSLQLGFSHDIDMPPPEGITFASARPGEVKIAGIDKQMVAKSPPASAASVRRSPTRARACATPAKRSGARKARRSKPWPLSLARLTSAAQSATACG